MKRKLASILMLTMLAAALASPAVVGVKVRSNVRLDYLDRHTGGG